MLVRGLAETKQFVLEGELRTQRLAYLSELNPQLRQLLRNEALASRIQLSELLLRIYRKPPLPHPNGPSLPALLALTLPQERDDPSYAPNRFETILVLCGSDHVAVLDGTQHPIRSANAVFGGLQTRAEWNSSGVGSDAEYDAAISNYLRMFCDCLSAQQNAFSILCERDGPNAIQGLDGSVLESVSPDAFKHNAEWRRKLQTEILQTSLVKTIDPIESAKSAVDELRRHLAARAMLPSPLHGLGVVVLPAPVLSPSPAPVPDAGAVPGEGATSERGADQTAPPLLIATAHAALLFSNHCFTATLKVFQNGNVEMIDDAPVPFESDAGLPVFEFRPVVRAEPVEMAFVMRRPKQAMSVTAALQFFARYPGRTLENTTITDDLTTQSLQTGLVAIQPTQGALPEKQQSGNATSSGNWDWELPLRFQYCEFLGSIDLDGANLRRHVFLEDCRVLGVIGARNCRFHGDLKILNCYVVGSGAEKSIDLKEWSGGSLQSFAPTVLDLRGSTIDGDLDLSGSRLEGSATLRNGKIMGRARLLGIKVHALNLSADDLGLPPSTIADLHDGWLHSAEPAEKGERHIAHFLRPVVPSTTAQRPDASRQRAVLEMTSLHVCGDLDLCSGEPAEGLRNTKWDPALVLGAVIMRQAKIEGDTNFGGLTITDFDYSKVGALRRWKPLSAEVEARTRSSARLVRSRFEQDEKQLEPELVNQRLFARIREEFTTPEQQWVACRELGLPSPSAEAPEWVAESSSIGVSADNNLVASGTAFHGQVMAVKRSRAHDLETATLTVLGEIGLDSCVFDAVCSLAGVLVASHVKLFTSRFNAWLDISSQPNENAVRLADMLQKEAYVAGLKIAHWRDLAALTEMSWDQDPGRRLLAKMLARRIAEAPALPAGAPREDTEMISSKVVTWIGGDLNLVSAKINSSANLSGVQCGKSIKVGALEVDWLTATPIIFWNLDSNFRPTGVSFLNPRCATFSATSLKARSSVRIGGLRVHGSKEESWKSANGVDLDSSSYGANLALAYDAPLGTAYVREMMVNQNFNSDYVQRTLSDEMAWNFIAAPLNYQTSIRGSVSISGASVNGQLDCSNCSIEGRLELKDSTVGADVRIAAMMQTAGSDDAPAETSRTPPKISTRCSRADLEFLSVGGDLKLAGLEVGLPVEANAVEGQALRSRNGELNARSVKVQGEIELCYPNDISSDVLGTASFRFANFEYAACKVFILPSKVELGACAESPQADPLQAWIRMFGAHVERLRVKWIRGTENSRQNLLDLQEARVAAWPLDRGVSSISHDPKQRAKYPLGYSSGFIALRRLFGRVHPFDSGTYASAESYLRNAGRGYEADALYRSMNRERVRQKMLEVVSKYRQHLSLPHAGRMLLWCAVWGGISALAAVALQNSGFLSASSAWQTVVGLGVSGAVVCLVVQFGAIRLLMQLFQLSVGELVGYGTRLPSLFLAWLGMFVLFYVGIGQHSVNVDFSFSHGAQPQVARAAEAAALETSIAPDAASGLQVQPPPGQDINARQTASRAEAWSQSAEPLWLSLSYAVPLFSLAIDEGRFDDFNSAPNQTCSLVRWQLPWSGPASLDAHQAATLCEGPPPEGYVRVTGSPRTWARIMRLFGWLFIALSIYGMQRMTLQLNRQQ